LWNSEIHSLSKEIMPLTDLSFRSALSTSLQEGSATRVAEAVRDLAAAELVAAGFQREGTLDTSLLQGDDGPCMVAGELVSDGATGDEMELRGVVQLRSSEGGGATVRIFIELVSIIELLRGGRPGGHTLWRHSVVNETGLDEDGTGKAPGKRSARKPGSLVRPALRARLQLAARAFARDLQANALA
jgi:hypothetical protein